MTIPSKIIFVDGRSADISRIDLWRKLREFVDKCYALDDELNTLIHAGGDKPFEDLPSEANIPALAANCADLTESSTAPSDLTSDSAPPLEITDSQRHISETSEKKDSISRPEKALISIGRPSTSEQIFKYLQRDGWNTNAAKPLDTIGKALRTSPRTKRVGVDDRGKSIWGHVNFGDRNAAIQSTSKTTADYGVEALQHLGGSARIRTIVALMEKNGWITQSQTERNKVRVVHATFSRDPAIRFKLMGDSIWRLNDDTTTRQSATTEAAGDVMSVWQEILNMNSGSDNISMADGNDIPTEEHIEDVTKLIPDPYAE